MIRLVVRLQVSLDGFLVNPEDGGGRITAAGSRDKLMDPLELERMLKYGVCNLNGDGEDAAAKGFLEADIDAILATRVTDVDAADGGGRIVTLLGPCSPSYHFSFLFLFVARRP